MDRPMPSHLEAPSRLADRVPPMSPRAARRGHRPALASLTLLHLAQMPDPERTRWLGMQARSQGPVPGDICASPLPVSSLDEAIEPPQ